MEMASKPAACKIVKLNINKPVLQLDPKIIFDLDIDVEKPVQLKFGNLVTTVKIKPLNPGQASTEAKMRISAKVLEELHIPPNITLSVKHTQKQQLRLGPVIGILTFPNTYANKLFGYYHNYRVMLKSGLLYVFGSQGVNPKTNTIKGYYFNSATNVWTKAELPYPDTVIDRCYPNAHWTHQQLEKYMGKGKIFNKKTMINKVDFYKAVSEDIFLKRYLPETRFCTKASDLEYFLAKYRKIFLKPLAGMQGIGIITASQVDKGIKCQYMVKGKVSEKEVTQPQQIISVLGSIGYPRRRYIIQEAIPVMGYQGKPFCFRIMVCKNGKGQWLVPAIFANAATGDSFLTNHAAGASKFVSLHKLFNDIEGRLKTTKVDFINSLVNLGIAAAGALDRKYGPLGEVGLDVVLDQTGKPRLLEGNGNPGMVPRSHMVDFPKWAYQAFNLPMSYAQYLAGFGDL